MHPFAFGSIARLSLPVMFFGVTLIAIGAEPSAGSNPKDSADPTVDPVEAGLDRGPIHSSVSILGSRIISEKGDTHGTIEDLMLDLQHGHVSTAILELDRAEKGKTRRIAVPWNSLHRNSNDEFELRVSPKQLDRATELHPQLAGTKATRRWASSVYEHFDSSEREIKRGAPRLDSNGLLASAAALQDTRVDDLKGEELGHLKGFAVATRDGLLVYAALATKKSDEPLQAIPLSAFIVKPAKKEWLLDISKSALAERPGFSPSAWVETVDVGWSEYVHVLYGRPVFEGVRSEPKAVEPSP